MAHEVTRDVTAWAYQFAFRKPLRASTLRSSFCFPTSGLEPMLLASSSRPGPASARSACASLSASPTQTVFRRSFLRSLTQIGWRSGFPTGRPWDFALDRSSSPVHTAAFATALLDAISTISRTLCLGSQALRHTSSVALARWVRRSADRRTLSSRGVRTRFHASWGTLSRSPLRHWRRL